jgi:hypothetical protein
MYFIKSQKLTSWNYRDHPFVNLQMDSTLDRILGKKNFGIADFLIAFGSIQTLWTYLVLGGVHPAGLGNHLKFCNFSKKAGDVQLWKIISCDLLGQFNKHTLAQIGQVDHKI